MNQTPCSRTDAIGKCHCFGVLASVIIFRPFVPNLCIDIANDGVIEWYGYRGTNPPAGGDFGTATPNVTPATNQHFYELIARANGDVRFSFGDAGGEQVVGVTQILLRMRNGFVWVAQWDPVNMYYSLNDQDLADLIIGADGTNMCGVMEVLPDPFIDYDFEEVFTV